MERTEPAVDKMEALLDFFDPTESQHSPPRRSEKDPLPSSLPPEVNARARVCIKYGWSLGELVVVLILKQ